MRHSLLLIISLCSYFLVHSQIPAGYYNSAIGLKNDSLKTALNDIIDGHIEFPYTSSSMDTWDVLKLADRDPTNSINVIGIYSNFSMNGPLEYNSAQGGVENTYGQNLEGISIQVQVLALICII